MGSIDRITRLFIAAVISILFLTHIISSTLGIILLVVSGILLLTSLISFCPLNTFIGVNTCSTEKNKNGFKFLECAL